MAARMLSPCSSRTTARRRWPTRSA
jgi:hypothetical protein